MLAVFADGAGPRNSKVDAWFHRLLRLRFGTSSDGYCCVRAFREVDRKWVCTICSVAQCSLGAHLRKYTRTVLLVLVKIWCAAFRHNVHRSTLGNGPDAYDYDASLLVWNAVSCMVARGSLQHYRAGDHRAAYISTVLKLAAWHQIHFCWRIALMRHLCC